MGQDPLLAGPSALVFPQVASMEGLPAPPPSREERPRPMSWFTPVSTRLGYPARNRQSNEHTPEEVINPLDILTCDRHLRLAPPAISTERHQATIRRHIRNWEADSTRRAQLHIRMQHALLRKGPVPAVLGTLTGECMTNLEVSTQSTITLTNWLKATKAQHKRPGFASHLPDTLPPRSTNITHGPATHYTLYLSSASQIQAVLESDHTSYSDLEELLEGGMARSIRHGLYKWPGHRWADPTPTSQLPLSDLQHNQPAPQHIPHKQPEGEAEHPKTGRGEDVLSTGNILPNPGPQNHHHKTGRGESLLSSGNVHPHPGPDPLTTHRRSRSLTLHPPRQERKRRTSAPVRSFILATPMHHWTTQVYVPNRESYMGPRGLGPRVDWEQQGLGSLLRKYVAQYDIFYANIKQTFIEGR